MIDRALKAWNAGRFLDEFIPVPQDLKETVKGFMGDDKEQKKLEKKQARNIKKYGHATWWDFCVSEWGTKWDIGLTSENDNEPHIYSDHGFHVYFDSAWSPPIQAYIKLLEMGFKIEAHYYEGGMGFCGMFIEGKDYEFNTDDIKSIPADLRNMFDIEENYEVIEEEKSE